MYKWFTINKYIGQFMLPSYKKCSVSYLKELLSDKKKEAIPTIWKYIGLKEYQLSYLNVPTFPKLSVKKMYLALKEDPAIKAFLTDYPKGRYPDQEFFHKLVWSLYPAQILYYLKWNEKQISKCETKRWR